MAKICMHNISVHSILHLAGRVDYTDTLIHLVQPFSYFVAFSKANRLCMVSPHFCEVLIDVSILYSE